MTIREFVSSIRNNLNSISPDSGLSSEYIYSIGVSYAKIILKRESDSRKIFRNTSMFKFIDCIKMKPSSISECSDVDLPCGNLMISVDKLPEIFISNYGSLLQVFSVDRSKDYVEANPGSYKNILGQRFKPKNKGYFWIRNGYLVIPDSEVEVVSAMYLSAGLEDTSTGSCKILDQPFPCLDYLVIAVIESTTKHLLTGKQIPIDENANNNARS